MKIIVCDHISDSDLDGPSRSDEDGESQDCVHAA